MRKGIILSGGSGTRLYPTTKSISKQLLPIYDKPMIFYSLSILMYASIQEILIISSPHHINLYKSLLGDGSNYGLNISYKIQKEPNGIAESLLIGEEFLSGDKSALILGDNFFYGLDFEKLFKNVKQDGATIFGCYVNKPENYGVIEFDKANKINKIVEKPKIAKSNIAVTGLYFFDEFATQHVKKLKISSRGELEITDLNNIYLQKKKLNLINLDKNFTWMDAGTPETLLSASMFVSAIQNRQGIKIACLEEIAFKKKWINKKTIENFIKDSPDCDYLNYVKSLIDRI